MATSNATAYRNYADTQASAFGIPKDFFAALINQESGWNPNAKGSSGEEGIAQLKPGTAPNINRFDPYASMSFSASLLRQYYDRFGTWEMAAAAYNAGPSAVNKYGDVPPSAQGYVSKIMSAVGLGTTSSEKLATTTTGGAAALTPSMSTAKILFWAAAVIVLIVVVRGVSNG